VRDLFRLHIPVYAESRQHFESDRNEAVRKQRLAADEAWQFHGAQSAPARKHHEIQVDVESTWGCWDYDRVVGWFRISVLDGVLEIDIFEHASSRFSRSPRLHYKLAERRAASLGSMHPSARDAEQWLFDALKSLSHTYFRTRHVDWKTLRTLLHHTDWENLLPSPESAEAPPRSSHSQSSPSGPSSTRLRDGSV
jgi:hypothetical protein